MLPLDDSSAIAHDGDRVRRTAAESGFLFFRGLVAPGPVFGLRDRVLRLSEERGWTTGPPDVAGLMAEVLPLPQFLALGDPLGDCPRVLGGLAILPGSHRAGLLAHGANGADQVAPGREPDPGWATIDYRCGDVLMFGGLTVHGAGPNRSGNQLRLSVDHRYQPAVEAASAIEEGP